MVSVCVIYNVNFFLVSKYPGGAEFKISVERHKDVLISPKNSKSGSNICGPSVIRVPKWVKNPLGKYYMYFARHSSSSMGAAFIRFCLC